MFIVTLKFLVSEDERQQFSQAHRDYWDFYFQEGWLITEGPTIEPGGEILILLGNDKEEVKGWVENDPVFLAGICQYEITQFSARKSIKPLKALISLKPQSKGTDSYVNI